MHLNALSASAIFCIHLINFMYEQVQTVWTQIRLHQAEQKIIDFGYSLELPRQNGSNEYPKSMFWTEKINKNKKYRLCVDLLILTASMRQF